MHEFAIASALIQAARTQSPPGTTRVKRLQCRIGVLRQIDSTLMRDAFEAARHDTCCATAELEITATHMHAECPACRHRFDIHDWNWSCPRCGGEAKFVGGGDELELVSLEVEVDE